MKDFWIENWYSITMLCLLLLLTYKISVREKRDEDLRKNTIEGRKKEAKRSKRRKIGIFILFFLAAWLFYTIALLHIYDNSIFTSLTYIGLGTVNIHLGKHYLEEYKKGRDKKKLN